MIKNHKKSKMSKKQIICWLLDQVTDDEYRIRAKTLNNGIKKRFRIIPENHVIKFLREV